MILQELSHLYDRLLKDPDVEIARSGFSLQNVTFRVVLTKDGDLVRIDDMCTLEKLPEKVKRQPKLRPQKRLLLGGGKPSGSGLNPCFLWDNSGYLLGYKGDGDEAHEARARECFAALRDKHLSVEASVNRPEFSAVCRFLESWDPEKAREIIPEEIVLTGNGIFLIDKEYVHENLAIVEWWQETGQALWTGKSGEIKERGICLVTGKEENLALLHEPAIKGVLGAQPTGAKIVSFNCPAFVSYSKEQSYNAPVGEASAFAYCNALNYLLARAENKLQIAGDTTVFWTDASNSAEMNEFFAAIINPPSVFGGDLDKRILHTLDDLANGIDPADKLADASTRFFFLGLEPNASRLSVTFWLETSLGRLLHAVHRHAVDISLQRQWTETNSKKPQPKLLRPYDLLKETVRDAKDIPKPYVGSLMRSILLQHPYPEAIAAAILLRIRLDHLVSYSRCSLLKGWLARHPQHSYTVKAMIDYDNQEPGYLLGRLFATYEKAQLDANKGRPINATIRDRYYSSASASPRAVFPILQRLHLHHIKKMIPAAKGACENLITKIQWGIEPPYPAHLNLAQQALFALGYYHQMNVFYTKNTKTNNKNNEQVNDNDEQN